ncbi:FIG00658223: hypothetical protein [Olavius algarvensis spirochete endosymbiont]|uniref:four helix bundle protein n=1 Tax=Olavius algarvensis spirochete endosymbiont TaxID=260710 RepID=UPI000F26871A|nr:four helix bundle protein [Olavius algarvensis spirochete endosymbiont]VDB00498.1 FIG00658223: hypothetical protein [Olavius algarvensis spirochete endosymbiont]
MNDELKTNQHSALSTQSSAKPQVSAELKITDRSFSFSVRVVKLCQFLENKDRVSKTLANQLLRSGTSIGANIEEAQAGQSKADFIAKMSIARKEARETHYWLRLLKESEIVSEAQLSEVINEADEIIRILTAIVKTSQTRNSNAR